MTIPAAFGAANRPISTSYNVFWSAYFTHEYDGAPDSHSLIGHGETEAEAVADLLEKDGERDD